MRPGLSLLTWGPGRASVLLLSVVLLLVVGVDHAAAEPLEGVTHCPSCADADKGARVVNWFLENARRGGAGLPDYVPPDASPPVGETPSWWATQAGEDYAASQAAQTAGTTGAESMAGETMSAGRLAGIFPKIPTLYAAAGAFVGGYLIGYGLNQLFFHIDTPSAPEASTYGNNPRWQSFDKGDTLFSDPSGTHPVIAPEPGFLYTWYQGAPVYSDRTSEAYAPNGVEGSCDQPSGPGVGVAIDSESYNPGCNARSIPYPPWSEYEPIVRRGYWLAQSKLAAGLDVPLRPASGDSGTNIGTASMPSRSALASSLPDVLNANPTLAKWFGSRFGDGADPTVDTITLSDCDGLTFIECRDALQALGVLGTITNHVLGRATAVLSKSPGKVTGTVPAVGSVVLPDDTVDVYTNPDPLPVLVPARLDRETRTHYLARLDTLGLTVHSVVTLTDATLDPTAGPDEVATTLPAAGSRVFPDENVTVRVNPDTAPEPIGGGVGAGGCGPAVPPIDLTPLQHDVGGKFPFGIFAWLLGALGGWTGGGEAPVIVIPFTHGDLVIDFNDFSPAMEIVRPVIGILSFLSLAWLFASAALGFGGAEATED